MCKPVPPSRRQISEEGDAGDACAGWSGTGAASVRCGQLSLEDVSQCGDRQLFGSTGPAAGTSVLLLSKQGSLVQHQTPLAVARLPLAP